MLAESVFVAIEKAGMAGKAGTAGWGTQGIVDLTWRTKDYKFFFPLLFLLYVVKGQQKHSLFQFLATFNMEKHVQQKKATRKNKGCISQVSVTVEGVVQTAAQAAVQTAHQSQSRVANEGQSLHQEELNLLRELNLLN